MSTTMKGAAGSAAVPVAVGASTPLRSEWPRGCTEKALRALATLLSPVLPAPLGVAAQLLHRFGSMGGVLAAGERALMEVAEMTPAAAQLIAAAHAATTLALRERVQRDVVGNFEDLAKWLRAELAFCRVERALGLFLDRQSRLIRCDLLGEGTIDHVPLYPREVALRALELRASAVILAHNHPSGDPSPSATDKQMTRDVAAALLTISVVLQDHIIVGRERIVSMHRLGQG